MSAPVIAVALLFWICVFMVYFTAARTTPLEFLLGRFEALPPDLGAWKEVAQDGPSGSICEQRLLLPGGHAGSSYLLLQTRYRDAVTRAIVRVGPEQRLPRRRVSSRP